MAFEAKRFDMSDAEVHAMAEVWEHPGAPTKLIAFNLYQRFDWAPGTSYTILTRCLKKGFASKDEKGCWFPLIEKEDVRDWRLCEMVEDLYSGSFADLICASVSKGAVSAEDIEEIKKLLAKME